MPKLHVTKMALDTLLSVKNESSLIHDIQVCHCDTDPDTCGYRFNTVSLKTLCTLLLNRMHCSNEIVKHNDLEGVVLFKGSNVPLNLQWVNSHPIVKIIMKL